MHELSVCRGMLHQIDAIARARNASRVKRIVVKIGPLSGVVPELLAAAFPVARAGTVAETAELALDVTSLRVLCERCGAESETPPNLLRCTACGDDHTRLVSGDELLLESVELVN